MGGLTHAKKIPFAHLEYNMEEADLLRFQKAFVGEVEILGITFNIQDHFNNEGYIGIKVTSLGANLCLLEEREECVLKVRVEEATEWFNQWFVNIRPWTP